MATRRALPYEAPELREVGALHEVTQGGCKTLSGDDGFYLDVVQQMLGSC